MKKALYYIMLVVTTILFIPFIVLLNIASVYIRLVEIAITIPAKYIKDAAPMPRWFKWVLDYAGYKVENILR